MERVTLRPPPSANKAAHSGFETGRGIIDSTKRIHVSSKIFF